VTVWYFLRPPSPDVLYQLVAAAINTPRADLLRRGIKDSETFLDSYVDDPRADEVADWRDELLDRERRRRWEIRVRAGTPPGGISPIEREYLDAMRYAAADPQLAQTKLQAMLNLYGTDGMTRPYSERRYLQMARSELDRLATRRPASNDAERKFVEERLAEADQLDAKDSATARKIRSAVVELYADKPWAHDLVEQAREHLSPPGGSSAQR